MTAASDVVAAAAVVEPEARGGGKTFGGSSVVGETSWAPSWSEVSEAEMEDTFRPPPL